MRINGWQRIGIVASVVWMLVAGIYTLNVTSDADLEAAARIYRDCADIRDDANQRQREYCWQQSAKSADYSAVFNKCVQEFEAKNPDTCSKRSADYAVNSLPNERIEAAAVALIPLPLAWGFAYLCLFLVRWVKRGFPRTP